MKLRSSRSWRNANRQVDRPQGCCMASFPCSVPSPAGIASPTDIHSPHAPHHSSQLRSSPPVSCPDDAIRRSSPEFPAAGAIELTANRRTCAAIVANFVASQLAATSHRRRDRAAIVAASNIASPSPKLPSAPSSRQGRQTRTAAEEEAQAEEAANEAAARVEQILLRALDPQGVERQVPRSPKPTPTTRSSATGAGRMAKRPKRTARPTPTKERRLTMATTRLRMTTTGMLLCSFSLLWEAVANPRTVLPTIESIPHLVRSRIDQR